MKRPKFLVSLAVSCSAWILSFAALGQAIVPGENMPEGPGAGDWSRIRTAYEASRHAAIALEDGYQARNPRQCWLTLSDGRGFTIVPDAFGVSVSVSGDTVVVGASGEDSNTTGVNGKQNDNSSVQSGAAYVFGRDGTAWIQQAFLKASNTDSHDYFGCSVSVSGDTVVAGADQEDSSATGVDGNQSDNGQSVSPGQGAGA